MVTLQNLQKIGDFNGTRIEDIKITENFIVTW